MLVFLQEERIHVKTRSSPLDGDVGETKRSYETRQEIFRGLDGMSGKHVGMHAFLCGT